MERALLGFSLSFEPRRERRRRTSGRGQALSTDPELRLRYSNLRSTCSLIYVRPRVAGPAGGFPALHGRSLLRRLLRELCPHPAPSADAAPCLPPGGGEATPGGFPRSLPFAWRGRCPALPLRAWCGDHAATRHTPSGDALSRRRRPGSPPFLGVPARRLPGPYPSGLSRGLSLEGVQSLVHSHHTLSALLAAPTPSDSPGASRRCQGCLPPFPAAPGSGCPQLPRAAATARRWGLAPHTNRQRLVAHERVVADARVRAALGDRPGDRGGHVAGDELELVAALLCEQIQELLNGLSVPTGRCPDQPSGVVVNHAVRYRWPLRIEISSTPIRVSPEHRSRVASASSLTRWQIQPTVRHAIRISCETAVFDACTVSHATWSSNWRVNEESCRAHGTAATTTPWSLQLTRGASASS